MRLTTILASIALSGPPAMAQLVLASVPGEGAWHIDVATGKATRLWTNDTVINALAVDEPARKAWLVSIFVLRDWEYYAKVQGVVAGWPFAGAIPGMAFGEGVLYGVTDAPSRILTIDPVMPGWTEILLLPQGWTAGDLAWEPASRRLVFPLFAGPPTATKGIYSIEPVSGAVPAFITAFPPGYANVGGLCVGAGRFWILEAGLPIRSYDLATGVWEQQSLPCPLGPVGPGVLVGAMDWSGRLPLRTTYCTAKASPAGCMPEIEVLAGYASAAATSGFVIAGTGAVNQSPGLLLHGLDGPAAVPFAGGLLCVAAPLRRSVVAHSGGSPRSLVDCTGTWRLDMNAFAAGNVGGTPHPELSSYGTTVHCQWWGRDRTDPAGSQLTNALRYDVEP
jgi:hypothetical protein